MKFIHIGNVTSFDLCEYGDLMLAEGATGAQLHLMKVFIRRPDGAFEDAAVSLGPFTDDAFDQPCLYSPEDVGGSAVLNVSDTYRFYPSHRSQYLARLKSSEEAHRLLGWAIMTPERQFLGVARQSAGSHVDVLYLDIESGEVIAELPDEPAVVTSRWQIIVPNDQVDWERVYEHRGVVEQPHAR